MTLTKNIDAVLKAKRVATIEELCADTSKAAITVKQALAKLDYVTSYDRNSRFYALRSTCRFNRDGIWKHAKASFTRHGTLGKLLVELVESSQAGRTTAELESATGVDVGGVLRRLAQKEVLVRVQARGQYYYFSARSKRARQAQARARFGSPALLHRAEEEMPAGELKRAIVVLLEIIRNRPRTVKALVDVVRHGHPDIPGPLVREICSRYDIELKKKIVRHEVFDHAVNLAEAFQRTTDTPFVFHFGSDQTHCPTCGVPTAYFKTTAVRTITTLRYGRVRFRESQVVCADHRYDPDDGAPLIYGSSFARTLAPARAPIGYDVIAEIGTRRFVNYRQVEEVVRELSDQGVVVSASTVSRWGDYFLAAVECLHHSKKEKIRRLIKGNGGYLLHIDCTTETKADTVFVCVDRVLGAVLLSEKVTSENERDVESILRRLKRDFGTPIAVMRDMSGQLGRAVQRVFPNVPDRICQFHLLRDIGKDLLQKEYLGLGHRLAALKISADLRRLRRTLERDLSAEQVQRASLLLKEARNVECMTTKALREHEGVVALRLVIDVLDYTKDGEGLGFPFDLYRISFCKRLNRLRLRLERYRRRHPISFRQCKNLCQLQQIVGRVVDGTLRASLVVLRDLHGDFQSLRSVLRFETKKEAPLASTMSIGTLREIRAYNRGLVQYTKQLVEADRRGHITLGQRVILKHLVTYQFKLPIPEHLAEILTSIDRTNNYEEGIFRDCKRQQRRQVGKKDISREFSLRGPYLPLLRNLKNEEYVAAVIGDMSLLPIRLSELRTRDVAYYLEKLRENRRGKFFDYLNGVAGIDLLPARR